MYDKREDFDFEIVNFTFLDGGVPRSMSYGDYISQHSQKTLTQKLLIYWYPKLCKTFPKVYRQYNDLTSKFNVGLNISCARDFQSWSFMETQCIN